MIITIAMQKGGAGKTTTAAAVWAAFPRSLGVDLDMQRNFTLITGADEDAPHNTYDILTGACAAKEAVQALVSGDIIGGAKELAIIGDLSPLVLRDALAPIREQYQHIVIDTPPALNMITLNALCAADIVIVPMKAEPSHLQGLTDLGETLDSVRDANPSLRVGGILLTQFNSRSILHRQTREMIEDFANTIEARVFTSTIRTAVAIAESQSIPQDIFSYAPKAKVTKDYQEFIRELGDVIGNG